MMKKYIQLSVITLCLVMFAGHAAAQQPSGSSGVIFRAIQDELNRSMNELNHPDAGKPFFAGFYVTEGTFFQSSATLGAILSSDSRKIAATSYRFMFGSYDMNDENFEESPSKEMIFPRNIADPIELDYAGIRRSLWNNVDHSFKSAGRNYAAKKAYFQKNPSLKPDFPDYIRQEPVIMELPDITAIPSQAQADSLARMLSYLFKDFENISSSRVSYSLVNCNMYLLNTEGTRLKIPFCFAAVDISATIKNGNGENMSESVSITSMDPFALLHDKTLAGKVKSLALYLADVAKAPKLDDEYSGPVLFTANTSVPQLMEALFSGKDALTANREEVKNTPAYRKTLSQSNNNAESKLGKLFMPAAFSVTVRPKLDSYKGIKLFGRTMVDYEGTIPPEEVKLVENGVLKDLLRNRVPSTKAAVASNGHQRQTLTASGIYSSLDPGVVFFSTSDGKTNSELKKLMLSTARSKGLEFAILVKPAVIDVTNAPEAYYKVSVADGSETLLQPLRVASGGGKLINHIAGCSNQELVVNAMGSRMMGGGGSVFGAPTSVILPDAIMFNDMTASPVDANVDKSFLPEEAE